MASYTDFLPKTGSGGGDIIGSVVELSSTLPTLVEIGDKSYLKEGFVVVGEESKYPEAFQQLNNKNGKAWDLFKASSTFSTSHNFYGIKKLSSGIYVISGSNTTIFVHKIDLGTELVTQVSTLSIAEGDVRLALFVGDSIVVTSSKGYVYYSSLSDNFATIKQSTYEGSLTGAAYAFEYRDGFIVVNQYNVSIVVFNKKFLKVATYSLNNISQGYQLKMGTAFVDDKGNDINILLTTNGKVLWCANTAAAVVGDWVYRPTPGPGFEPTSIAYCKSANLLFIGGVNGETVTSSSTLLDPVVSNFKGAISYYPKFFQGDENTVYFSSNFGNNLHKFNDVDKVWEIYPLPTSIKLNLPTPNNQGLATTSDGALLGVGRGANPYSSAWYILHSYNSVGMFPTDIDRGNSSRYLRIK